MSRSSLVQDGGSGLEEDDAEYSGVNYIEEVIYDEEEDAEIDINDVEGEIEVDASHEEWGMPMEGPTLAENHVSKGLGAPSVVLKTIDDLRMRPRIHVQSGKPSTKHPKHPLSRNPLPLEREYEDDQSLGIAGSSKVPSIRGALRMYADVALRNAERIRVSDVEEVVEEYDTDVVEEDIQPETSHAQTIFTHKDWPLYSDQPIDFQEASEILCGTIDIDRKLICGTVPQCYKGEGTFLVDARAMKNRGDDQHGDGLGIWSRPTGRAQFYTKTKEEPNKIMRIDDGKGKILRGIRQVFKCMMRRYEHPVTVEMNNGGNRFIKKVYSAMYPSELNKTADLVVITYEWTQKQPCDFPLPQRLQSRGPVEDNWEPSPYTNRSLPGIMTGYFGDIPIYSVCPVDFSHAATIILGGVAVDPRKIAPSVPQGYRDPGTFVIDMEHCPAEAMLRRDDNGIWGKPAGTSRYYVIDPETLDAIRIDTANRLPDQPHDIQILCKRYEHPAVDGRFVRKIYSGRTASSSTMPHKITLSVITYSWKGDPVPFQAQRKQNQVLAVEGNYTEEEIWPERTEPVPTKRRKSENRNLFEGESQADQELRQAVWKKEYENQVRFAALLDRADTFIARLEQVSTNIPFREATWEEGQEQSTSQRRSMDEDL